MLVIIKLLKHLFYNAHNQLFKFIHNFLMHNYFMYIFLIKIVFDLFTFVLNKKILYAKIQKIDC
ncbi:hypothetical protein EC396_09350 [Lutibacter sp. HS1-25]|nr:hypothetical protein EC396_09350 [Lutibacter sp. HS1-25]